jgi:hypothetical protein
MVNQPDPRIAAAYVVQSPERVSPGEENIIVRSATTGGSYGESSDTNYVDPAGNQIENRIEMYQDKNLSLAKRRVGNGSGSAFPLPSSGSKPGE